jgi:hypothetical protein
MMIIISSFGELLPSKDQGEHLRGIKKSDQRISYRYPELKAFYRCIPSGR